MKKEKEIVKKTVLAFARNNPITWKQIKHFQFEDDDEIRIGYVEPWENGDDNSGGDHYEVEILRCRLETDEEFNKRMEKIRRDEEWSKKRRYESYLRLKEEFDPNNFKLGK